MANISKSISRTDFIFEHNMHWVECYNFFIDQRYISSNFYDMTIYGKTLWWLIFRKEEVVETSFLNMICIGLSAITFIIDQMTSALQLFTTWPYLVKTLFAIISKSICHRDIIFEHDMPWVKCYNFYGLTNAISCWLFTTWPYMVKISDGYYFRKYKS